MGKQRGSPAWQRVTGLVATESREVGMLGDRTGRVGCATAQTPPGEHRLAARVAFACREGLSRG